MPEGGFSPEEISGAEPEERPVPEEQVETGLEVANTPPDELTLPIELEREVKAFKSTAVRPTLKGLKDLFESSRRKKNLHSPRGTSAKFAEWCNRSWFEWPEDGEGSQVYNRLLESKNPMEREMGANGLIQDYLIPASIKGLDLPELHQMVEGVLLWCAEGWQQEQARLIERLARNDYKEVHEEEDVDEDQKPTFKLYTLRELDEKQLKTAKLEAKRFIALSEQTPLMTAFFREYSNIGPEGRKAMLDEKTVHPVSPAYIQPKHVDPYLALTRSFG